MSKLLEMAAEIVVNQDTGKRRICTHIYRDESLDLTFILSAEEAEQWAARMMFMARECRKQLPTTESFSMQFKRKLWRIFTKS
jgi:hypothetical protein